MRTACCQDVSELLTFWLGVSLPRPGRQVRCEVGWGFATWFWPFRALVKKRGVRGRRRAVRSSRSRCARVMADPQHSVVGGVVAVGRFLGRQAPMRAPGAEDDLYGQPYDGGGVMWSCRRRSWAFSGSRWAANASALSAAVEAWFATVLVALVPAFAVAWIPK